MSDEATPLPVKVLKKEALINVTIGAGFYERLTRLMVYLSVDKTQEQIDEAIHHIENKTVTDPWIASYETVVALVKELEKKAEEQGWITTKTDEGNSLGKDAPN